MGYEWKTKTITFGKGIRDDADEFQLEPPFVAKLRNGVFDKAGSIGKRKGLEFGTQFSTDPTTTPKALFAVDNRLNAASEDTLYTLTEDSWEEAVSFDTLSARTRASIENNGNAQCLQVVEESGIVCAAWIEQNLTDHSQELFFQFFDPEGRPLSAVVNQQDSIGPTPPGFRLLSNSTVGIVLVTRISDDYYFFRSAPPGASAFSVAVAGISGVSNHYEATFIRHQPDSLLNLGSNILQHSHRPNTTKSVRYYNIEAALVGNQVFIQTRTPTTSNSLAGFSSADLLIEKFSVLTTGAASASKRLNYYTHSCDLISTPDGIASLAVQTYSIGSTSYNSIQLSTWDSDLGSQKSRTISSVNTNVGTYWYGSGAIAYSENKFIIAISETFLSKYDYENRFDPVLPGVATTGEYYSSTVILSCSHSLTNRNLLKRIPNTRVGSNFVTTGGKNYVTLSEVAHAPRSFFAESDLYLNDWKASTVCSVSESGDLVPVIPLLPNTCYDYNQMEAVFNNAKNHFCPTAILAREALFPYGIADDSYTSEDISEPPAFTGDIEIKNVHLHSFLKSGNLPKTQIKLHSLAREEVETATHRGTTVLSAGTTYTYDGFVASETAILGIPKITSLSATGYVADLVIDLTGNVFFQNGLAIPFSAPSIQTSLAYGSAEGDLTGSSGNLRPALGTVTLAGNSQPNPTAIIRENVVGWLPESRAAYSVFALQAVVSYTDAKGNVHRSAPSPTVYCTPYLLKFSKASGWSKMAQFLHTHDLHVTVAVPLTADPSKLTVEIYGNEVESMFATSAETNVPTTVNSILQLIGSGQAFAYTANQQGGTVVTCRLSDQDKSGIDAVANTVNAADYGWYTFNRSLSAGKQLYTESGELPPGVIGNILFLRSVGNRMFAVPANDPNTVIYSKNSLEKNLEFPVEFRVEFPEDDAITGIADLDDKLIVFFPNKAYVVYGSGPDILGNGSQYEIQPLPGTIGCSNNKSIVEIPQGVMFQNYDRLYILDRSLNFNERNELQSLMKESVVTASVVHYSKGYVVFALAGNGTERTTLDRQLTALQPYPPRADEGTHYETGYAAIFDYLNDQWSVFTNYQFSVLAAIDGVLYGIRPNWDVMRESDNYQDAGISKFDKKQNKLFIESPWIKLQNMQDYGIVRRVTCLARFYDQVQVERRSSTLNMSLQYNYEYLGSSTVKSWKPLELSKKDGEVVQVSLRPKKNKVQSIKVQIYEDYDLSSDEIERTVARIEGNVTEAGPAAGWSTIGSPIPEDPGGTIEYEFGRGYEVSAIDLEIGLVGGPKRLSSRRKQ